MPRLRPPAPITIVRRHSERSAARLAHQSGGLGVPSSNLGAPTNHIKDLTPKTPQCRARRGRCTLVAQSGESITVRECLPSRGAVVVAALRTSDYIGNRPSGRRMRARSLSGWCRSPGWRADKVSGAAGAKVGCVDDLMGSPFGSETRTSRPPAAAGSAFGCELAKNSEFEDDSLSDWRAILPSVANVSTRPVADLSVDFLGRRMEIDHVKAGNLYWFFDRIWRLGN